jgi:hypothetical protein
MGGFTYPSVSVSFLWVTQGKTEKERQLATGGGWGEGGGGGGAKSFYCEKGWSYKNHSILSGVHHRETDPFFAVTFTDSESLSPLLQL